MTSQPTTFLTGATGFLGHFILRDLLRGGRRVVILLRPPLDDSVERLTRMMTPLGVDLASELGLGRVVAVEGALGRELPASSWGRTDEILSCAASLQLFSNGNGEPFASNVQGVVGLIEWAQAHAVERFHAVSTAYVCGMNGGVIAERLHEPQPRFQTDYERSKWEAEALLSGWASRTGAALTIYRPSFVVGESETGYTTQFGGFYQLARLVSMLARQNGHTPPAGSNDNGNGDASETYVALRIPLDPDGRHNVVPVDFVARAIALAVGRPGLHGRIYHLTDPNPPDNDFWKQCFERAFHLHGGYFVDPKTVNGARSEAEAMLWEQIDVLVPRLRHTPRFDQTHTRELLAAGGLSFPELTSARVHRLLTFATESAWGKRSTARGGPLARAGLLAARPTQKSNPITSE